ncbi:Ribosomal RNA large subunit methyltransferase I [Picochlorum sp. SENEW3]|nr:Ribosomal RNA large subunit methyltransferase I [Picochlorum sp. SENEW3]
MTSRAAMPVSVMIMEPHALAKLHSMPGNFAQRGWSTRCSSTRLIHGRIQLDSISGRQRVQCSATTPSPPSQPCLAETLPRVVLKGGKNKLFQGENRAVIVYTGAIDCVIGRPPPKAGDAVLLCNGDRRVIALGVINPESLYAVRIVEAFDRGVLPEYLSIDNIDAEELVQRIIRTRIDHAMMLRQALSLPCRDDDGMGRTTAYRLINSEGDYISGLIVDVFDRVAVVSSSAIWIERRKPSIMEHILQSLPHVDRVVWRPSREMLEMEGMTPEELDALCENDSTTEQGNDAANVQQQQEEEAIVEEFGAKFHVAPRGQKTGFYVDQRDNRSFISQISKGKDVLDICCYSGGFSIQAARGGAASVTGIDSSQAAIGLAQRNATLNGFNNTCTFVKNDASKFMNESIDQKKQWDIVILDPPKLAPTRKSLTSARRKYESLNTKAMKLVKPGGLLMTCSCSGAMTQSHGQFTKVILSAARRAGVSATILHKRGAGGDHPINPNYPEGEYLSNYLVRIL